MFDTPSPKNTLSISRAFLTLLIVSLLCSFAVSTKYALGAKKEKESPKRAIVVKDYKWASGGMGRAAIMQEITLENRGEMDYKDIAVEVDLYTSNDIPLGSLRATINEVLPSKSEKTFYNVKFGIMHSELENTVARIAGAEPLEKGTPTNPRDLILVKDWEWSGGQYGTEGILKSITLANKSKENFKDIKIRVDYLGLKGGKVGVRGFTSRATIHDVLPAKSERTYTNINVGFRHPDSQEESISVMAAKPISDKELNYRIAKKEGKPVKKTKKKKKKSTPGEGEEEPDSDAYSISGEKLSLSERYKKRLESEQGVSTTPKSTGDVPDTPVDPATGDSTPGDVALSDTETEKTETIAQETTQDPIEPSVPEVSDVEADDEEDYEYEYEEETPLPENDIVVEDFEWGGGVTGTIGRINKLTLKNISGISYTKIELLVEFYSYAEETPMGSNRVVIYDVLPPKSTRTFKDLKAGYLNAIPQEVRIKVTDAIATY